MKEFKTSPNINWKLLINVDPDDLPQQEEFADNSSITSVNVEVNELKDEDDANVAYLIQNCSVTDEDDPSINRVDFRDVEQAGEGQGKFEIS